MDMQRKTIGCYEFRKVRKYGTLFGVNRGEHVRMMFLKKLSKLNAECFFPKKTLWKALKFQKFTFTHILSTLSAYSFNNFSEF